MHIFKDLTMYKRMPYASTTRWQFYSIFNFCYYNLQENKNQCVKFVSSVTFSLSARGKLTDWEYRIMQTHPREGYEMLLSANVDRRILNAAYMHHERCDGAGYPQRLRADQIEPFAKLVAIADVYDAMTCARLYRGAMCPFKVIAVLEDEGLQKYDPQYILTFLKNIVDTYLLQSVRLSNGEVGQIVFINPNKLSRPTIRIKEKYIDLSTQSNLYIDSVV